MYFTRIQTTPTPSAEALRLKTAMIKYHEFRNNPRPIILKKQLTTLTSWQSARLKHTHKNLYQLPEYSAGLHFLFSDLYSAQDFSQRDSDLERIFPKMVKYLPKNILDITSLLVELNHLTQDLDEKLCEKIFDPLTQCKINELNYCNAYRACENKKDRLRQINLTSELGQKLDKYARSSIIHFSIKMMENPAKKAGLGTLHNFLMTGFSSFHSMKKVSSLMEAIKTKEQELLFSIFETDSSPFDFGLSL